MRVFFAAKCVFSLMIISFFAYKYIDRQNLVTEKRLEIPRLQKKLKRLEEENVRLQYEIDKLETPAHLMQFARKKSFRHLKYPMASDVTLIDE